MKLLLKKNNTSEQPRLATVNTDLDGMERFGFKNYVDIDPDNIVPESLEIARFFYDMDKAKGLADNISKLTGENNSDMINQAYKIYSNPKRSNKTKKKQIRLNNSNIQKEIRKRNLVHRLQDNM